MREGARVTVPPSSRSLGSIGVIMQYEQDDFVSVMPASDTEGQVRVTCPDKTGLGSDITRTIFDFGLVAVKGDFATDGKWAFVLVTVKKQIGLGNSAINWNLLRQRLENICPSKASISTLSSLNLAVRKENTPFAATCIIHFV